MPEPDVPLLVSAAAALLKTDQRITDLVAGIEVRVKELVALAGSGHSTDTAFCAAMALAVVDRRMESACNETLEVALKRLQQRRHAPKDPGVTEEFDSSPCQYLHKAGNVRCSRRAMTNPPVPQSEPRCDWHWINADGRTPAGERDDRIKNGRCGDCGSESGHFAGCVKSHKA